MYHVLIGYGLPGSGKTTYFNKHLSKNSPSRRIFYYNKYIDCDSLVKNSKDNKNLLKLLDEYLSKIELVHHMPTSSNYYVYIDGLFTTNDQVKQVVNMIEKYFTMPHDITVEWWKENREACIWNDEYRRDKSSILTIKNMPFEKLDIFKIRNETGVNVKQNIHQVVKKSKEMHYLQDKGLSNEKILKSDYWCLGGEWRDCYDGRHPVSAESPVDFKEFDELLEEIVPDLSFLKYKRLYSECVKAEDWYESDYYGGGVTNCHYLCDLEKLISMLMEWGLIKEEE